MAAVRDLCLACGASRSGSPPTRPSGPCSGAGERPPSPRWAVSRPTTTSRMASFRGHVCRRCCAGSTRSRPSSGWPRRQRLPRGRRQPPPARALRRPRRRGRPREGARRGDPRGLHGRGRLAHGRARGSAWTRRVRCRACSARSTSRSSGGSAAPSTPTGLRTRARCCRRPGSAARCPGRTGRIRFERLGLAIVSSVEEASDFLAAASAEGRAVRIGDDLPTGGLARVLEHEAGDLTCTVEAGIRLSSLATVLGRADQRLSLDPPGDPTVGACLAADLGRPAAAPLRHPARPRPRRHARARGRDDRLRGRQGREERRRLRPGKLVCGSRGTLGLIARVSLRFAPAPAVARTVVVRRPTPAGCLAAIL